MKYRKLYGKEREAHPDLYGRSITTCETERIFHKLCRHYNIRKHEERPTLTINPRFNIGRGRAFGHREIEIGRETSLGVLAHEVSHLINNMTGGRGHDKGYKRWMKKVATYIRKRKYYGVKTNAEVLQMQRENNRAKLLETQTQQIRIEGGD